jgi:Ca2+-binding RTX toxin-like protein
MTTIVNPISDYMANRGTENRVIDLNTVFTGEGLTFTVSSSDPDVAAVTLDGSQLTIDYLETLGHTDLEITATDANGISVTDNVRLRVASESAYTIAVIPDIQVYTYSGELDQTLNRMMQWLVDNKETHNIQFATSVGDLTQNNLPEEWDIVTEALSKLDGEIPYSVLPGNHDGPGSTSVDCTMYNNYYSAAQLAAANPDTFGGAYDQEPESGANTYSTFTAPDGTKWISLSLEYCPRPDVLRWAGEVLEANPDSRVMVSTHYYMNFAGRYDAMSSSVYDEGGALEGRANLARYDGETMWRDFVSQYPNIMFTFSGHVYGDSAETLVSYNEYGQPVYQMLANYQDGGAKEISGNGDTSLGGRGGQGAIRLLVIDPEASTVSTETYLVNLDEYITGSRETDELNRDGLTGEYRDQEEVIENVDLGPIQLFVTAKAGNDMQVAAASGEAKGEVTLSASETLNPGEDDQLTYVWTDNEGREIARGATPTVELDAGNHILTLTVTDSKGNTTSDDVRISVSNDQTLLVENFNDGEATGWTTATRVGVKTSGNGEEASSSTLEDRLFDYSDAANKVIVWTAPEALSWSNYSYEVTLYTTDNDSIGAVFYYQDANNYYRVVFDGETNTRSLIKVQGGVVTTLASIHQFTPFQQDMELKIAVHDGVINVFLDGHNVFGTVVDDSPLSGGTVGFYSNNQRQSAWDNIAVNPITLTAFAGDDQQAVDADGNGLVTVSLSGEGSYGLEDIASYVWTDEDGNIVATGQDASVEIATGTHELTLTVTDTEGNSATDHVIVEGVEQDRVLVSEDFSIASSLSNWTIVDEGEFGGVGVDGTSSQWELQDGRLVQLTDLASRQLTWTDASPTDVYDYLVGAGFWKIMLNLQAGVKPSSSVLPIDWANATPESIWTALSAYIDTVSVTYAWDPAMTAEIKSYFGDFFEGQATELTWPAAADGAVWDSLFEWISPVTWVSTWEGEDNVWERGWSPLGDGVNILRKGTYALYNDPDAAEWTDYAVETTIETPDNGAVGVLIHYQDANNYYKVELDASGDYDSTPENGAGSLWQVVQVVDGIESYLYQLPAKYTPGEAFELRVEMRNGELQAYVNGEAIFAYALEGEVQDRGTFGLFSWGSAGVSFDNVTVVALDNIAPDANDDSGFAVAYGDVLNISADQLLGNDDDADNDDLTIIAVDDAVGGTVTLDEDGNVIFTAEEGFSGAASFTYTVFDGGKKTSTATVSLTVAERPNTAPVPINDSMFTTENEAVTGSFYNLISNDNDAENDALQLVSIQDVVGGTISLSGNRFTFTPHRAFSGEASFTYTVKDSFGATATGTATITVADRANTAPTTFQLSASTISELAGKGSVIGAFSAVDAEGDALAYTLDDDADGKFAIKIEGGVAKLVVNGSLDYEAAQTETVTVTVDDGYGGKTTQNFTISIGNEVENTAPGGLSLSASTVSEAAAVGSVVGILSASDAEGDALTYSLEDDADGMFAIVTEGGETRLVVNGRLDFETASSHVVDVVVSDGEFETSVDFTISVTDAVDLVTGDAGNNVLEGAQGADILRGFGGNDTLYGYEGGDTLVGGKGQDRLYGGKGADVFEFSTGDTGKSRAVADTIYDFAAGDIVDLSAWDAKAKSHGVQDFDFIGGQKFHGKAGELRFEKEKSDTWIEGDTDGNGRADFLIHLDDAMNLKSSNFDL